MRLAIIFNNLPFTANVFLCHVIPTYSYLWLSVRRWNTCHRRPAAGRDQRLSKSSSPQWCITNSQSLFFFTKPSVLLCNVLFLASLLSCYFPSSGQKNFNCWTTGRRLQWKFSWWVWLITINTCYQDFLEILYISIVVSCLPWLKQLYFLKLFKYVIHEGIAMRARLICH